MSFKPTDTRRWTLEGTKGEYAKLEEELYETARELAIYKRTMQDIHKRLKTLGIDLDKLVNLVKNKNQEEKKPNFY